MKIKAVVKAVIFSYLITGLGIIVLAFLMYRLDPEENIIRAGIVITYILSCFLGGFITGRMVKKDRYVWGIASGFLYFCLLILISFIISGGFTFTIQHFFSTMGMCLGSGCIGGMLS